MSSPEKVCVIGLGYIGLPTSVVLAQAGKQVVGVDVNADAVASINSGKAHIVEPDLDGLLHSVVARGNLVADTKPQPADVFVIAVPTPFKGDHEPDLDYVESAARAIAEHVQPGNLVVLESTVPPGATEAMVGWILDERPELGGEDGQLLFHAAHCPERVLPGRILIELVENDRVVGGVNEESTEVARAFYQSFVRGESVGTTARTAELAKLSENAFRDTNIAFANELSMIAARLDVDIWELIALANRHPRVNILTPGAGVGGHCIAVDPWFIVDAVPDASPFIREARATNLRKTDWVIERVVAAVDSEEAVVACLGLAYKPDVDDLRESPAVEVVRAVAARIGRPVLVVEPHIESLPTSLEGAATLVSIEEAIERADLLVPLVAHRVFAALSDAVAGQTIVDPAGVWS